MRSNTGDLQSMVDFEASQAHIFRAVGRDREESAASEQARRHLPASLLLQRATAARQSQHEARKTLVHCLMYSRTPPLPADVLRKIHAAVPTVPLADYPSANGLLKPPTSICVTGIVRRKELNGQNATLLGTHAETGRYMIRLVSGEEIKVKAENVLPLVRPIQASENAGEEEEEDEDYDDDDEYDDWWNAGEEEDEDEDYDGDYYDEW